MIQRPRQRTPLNLKFVFIAFINKLCLGIMCTHQLVLAPVDTLLQEAEVFVRFNQPGLGHHDPLGGLVGDLLSAGSVVEHYEQAVLE